MNWPLCLALWLASSAALATPPPPEEWTNAIPAGRLVDLTHTFDAATPYWPTASDFEIRSDFHGRTPAGFWYESNTIRTSEHGGTHLDAPAHFAEHARHTDEIPLSQLMGPAVVLDVELQAASDRDYQVNRADFDAWEAEHGRLPDGSILLIRTGFSRFWPDRESYMGTAARGSEAVAFLHFPGLDPAAARWLVAERNIEAIGIDTPSIDHGQSSLFETHQTLFARNIPAFENLASLESLPATGSHVIALPMKIRDGSGGPLRIVAVVPDAQDWQYFLAGNAQDLTPATRGLWVLQGGGDDVDENYRRMGELAGHGDFVVLRASGTDDYNEYIFPLCDCDSVETLVFSNRAAASDPEVLRIIEAAEAVFIAGGDQSNYIRYWQGTSVEQAINRLAARGIPIGGTSAGMAVMGEFVYSAMTEASLTSIEALADPFHPNLTLARNFLHLPGLEGILTDQHLQERDRIGRTLALMARLVEDGWTGEAKAIAADRETALHIDPATLEAEVFATAKHPTPFVYFLAGGKAERCAPGEALSYSPVSVYRLGPGGSFNLRSWTGTGGVAYTLSAKDGKLQSSRGEVY